MQQALQSQKSEKKSQPLRLVLRKPDAVSDREWELTTLVAQGLTNRQIANRLFISEATVKNHLRNIFMKMKVQDRLELTLYVIHHSKQE